MFSLTRYFKLLLKEDQISLDLLLCFQSFTVSYFKLGYFKFPAIPNSSFFPYIYFFFLIFI